jgi:CarD family transcriptional regulator
MFKKGNLVLHRCYGVGTVVDVQKIRVTADEQIYYIIDLAAGGRLLFPAKQAEQLGLSPLVSPEAIIHVLLDAPESLADDSRLRKTDMDQKMGSGDPLRVAEVLRDLTWRGRDAKLSSGDLKLKCEAHKFLSSVLAAQPGSDTLPAPERLDVTLKQAIRVRAMPT